MAKQTAYALIMAGGRGTRFWPRSRRASAKQVLNFVGDSSLIQDTVDRLSPVFPPERIWIVTNHHLRAEIIRQLPQVPKHQIIAEPAARNTAPCIGLAAQMIHASDPNAVLGVFPADHLITRPQRFLRLVRAAVAGAKRGEMVVMGIEPRWAETGYGYIEFEKGIQPGGLDTLPVRSFREKPDEKTAKKFVAAKRFFWNAGMFFWRVDVVLDALRHHLPKTATLLASLPPASSKKFTKALEEVFPKCENISIDYAVMEKATNIRGIAADDIGWNDLGSWNAVYEAVSKLPGGNAVRESLNTPLVTLDATGNYVETTGKMAALVGVNNLVVVETADALLVVDRQKSQQVGDLVKILEQIGQDHLL